MAEERNRKNFEPGLIYSKVVKHGVLIQDLAKEYNMSEEDFLSKLENNIRQTSFFKIKKSNEQNLKRRKSMKTAQKETVEIASKKPEVKQEEKFQMERKSKKRMEKVSKRQKATSENMSALEDSKAAIELEITDKNNSLEEAMQILIIREETVTKTLQVFNEAKKQLEKANSDFAEAEKIVTQHEQSITNLTARLKKVENEIIELKNKIVYLVAPGYTGKKPEFGTFYSTTMVQGYDTLSVQETSAEYAIMPELNDMVVVAGYDSYKEYMEALGFVILCKEYASKNIDHTVLVSDERLEKLLKAHI